MLNVTTRSVFLAGNAVLANQLINSVNVLKSQWRNTPFPVSCVRVNALFFRNKRLKRIIIDYILFNNYKKDIKIQHENKWKTIHNVVCKYCNDVNVNLIINGSTYEQYQ